MKFKAAFRQSLASKETSRLLDCPLKSTFGFQFVDISEAFNSILIAKELQRLAIPIPKNVVVCSM